MMVIMKTCFKRSKIFKIILYVSQNEVNKRTNALKTFLFLIKSITLLLSQKLIRNVTDIKITLVYTRALEGSKILESRELLSH